MSTATNSNEPDFGGHLQRQLLGCELPPAQQTSYRRLLTTVLHGAPFQFVLCEIFDQTRRDRLIEIIDQAAASAGLSSHRIDCRELPDSAGLKALEALLNDLAARHTILHLCGFDHWLSRERWQALNIRRDAIAARCRAKLLWWLNPDSVRQCALEAPDLWAWRSGVYDFTNTNLPALPTQASYTPTIDPRSTLERTQRISQIKAWLQQDPPDELRLPLLDELAMLLQDFGQLDQALHIRFEEQLPIYEKLGDVRSRAVTLGKIADIHQMRGQLAEALRTRLDEEMPVYEKLGDELSRAVTLGKIADIHQARGQLDQALHIRLNEQLPVYEKLGNVHSRAVTLGKVADIYQVRGQLAEALRIRLDEQLPIYQKLGDIRSRAITLGKIADIYQARGQLAEALHIRLDEQLPVFEKLGDVYSRAVALGQIANIHQARGEFDQALRIHVDEQLPVFEKLGDVYSKAVTLGQIADIHLARGDLDQALRIHINEQLPVFEKLGDVYSKAVTLGQIASIYQARGQFDQALRIRINEEIPVFEKLGDIREILVAEANIAITLIERGHPQDLPEARRRLQRALKLAEQMQLPREISTIREYLDTLPAPRRKKTKKHGQP